MFEFDGGILMRKKGIIGCAVFAIVLLLVSVVLITGSRSVVDAKDGREKRFTSIQVQEGDSLWSIAKEHMSKEYPSIDDYIQEVCDTNNIYDQKITADMYLVIPYYTDVK